MSSHSAKPKKVLFAGLDGADPMLLQKLIDQGRLPNFRKLLEMGATTQDIGMQGALPTITLPN